MIKLFITVIALFAFLATPAVAVGLCSVASTEAQKAESAREAVVPAAELKTVTDR